MLRIYELTINNEQSGNRSVYQLPSALADGTG